MTASAFSFAGARGGSLFAKYLPVVQYLTCSILLSRINGDAPQASKS